MLEQVQAIYNVFTPDEMLQLSIFVEQGSWNLSGYSANNNTKLFWKKDIFETPAYNLFSNKIQSLLNKSVVINELYVNGQAHGQSGNWHVDQQPSTPHIRNDGTLVYFPKVWRPEYGGHLLIEKDQEILSILPEFNKGVIFDSGLQHIGLEPTMYCMTQRESIACKFKVLT
jgi:Rps23 Pro-64 3,4-dihydroxylase Tpa1-like proline 4-hydroxylase